MTDRPKQNFDENDIRRMVESLPSVEADPEFRERLRSSFSSGQIDPSPAAQKESKKGLPFFKWLYWAAPVAATAVVLLVINVLNQMPDMRVLEVTGPGEAIVDGRAIDLGDLEALAAGIQPGKFVGNQLSGVRHRAPPL